MGVHIYEAIVSINGSTDSAWSLLEASASEIHVDGAAGGPARTLVFSANIDKAKVKLTRNSKDLANISCSNLLLEGTVKAEGPLNVEVIHISKH